MNAEFASRIDFKAGLKFFNIEIPLKAKRAFTGQINANTGLFLFLQAVFMLRNLLKIQIYREVSIRRSELIFIIKKEFSYLLKKYKMTRWIFFN